jgi:glycyl-tRNA synthetase beta chain
MLFINVTKPGDIVSIADKMDTVVGCFGVGIVPTGTADPLGLRRQALGIIRIIVDKKYSLSLSELIEESEKQLKEKMERPVGQVEEEVLDFFRVRYQNFLLDKGYTFDVTDAVLSISFDDLVDVQGRIDALKKAREWKDFESIVIAFKRAMNILKGSPPRGEINPSLFAESVEQNLCLSSSRRKKKSVLISTKETTPLRFSK